MKRIIGAIVLALGLTACTTYEAVEEAVVIEEPAPVEPVAGRLNSDCTPTDTDDGIGGTGCKVVDFPPIGDKPSASSRFASANLLMIFSPEF